MKTLLIFALACVGVVAVLHADPVMTFDDLATTDGLVLGPGYHLLNWTNFAFLNGVDYGGNPSGYQAGVVSGQFVIWGGGSGVTSTISGGMFDLLSAYATSAWNDNLQLEAKGFIKGTLVYDQIYTLSATTPTLLNFDFYGVDEVDFMASGGTHHAAYTLGTGPEFCFDNLSVQTYLPYAPQLLRNGGFETGDFTGWSHTGDLGFTWVTNTAQYVHSGTYGVQFGPVNPGFISQVINPTQISQSYTVSFWLEHPVGNSDNFFAVLWGGVPVYATTNAGAFGWTQISLNLPASRLDEFLEFECTDAFDYYGLDDVSVAPMILLNNGGFETGDFSDWDHTGITNEDSVVPAAKLVGTFGAQLGAVGGLGSISQDVASQPGQPYLISAWLNNLNPPGGETNRFRVAWGGQVQANTTNVPAAGWTNVHYTVVNGNSLNTLRFGFENDPSFFNFDEASVWPTPLIQNGGFEFGDLTGWTTNGNIAGNAFVSTNANSGYYGGEFGPVGSLGYISQTVQTVPGQAYLIGFMLNNLLNQTNGLEFTASWDGTTLMELTNTGLFGWVPYEFAVTASSDNTTLQFGFRDDPWFWGLDDVFISPITPPEFESVARNGNNVDLIWTEMPGYTYQLQYTTNLLKTNWTTLQTIFQETNIPMSTIDTNPPDPQRFYRLKMVPPPLIF